MKFKYTAVALTALSLTVSSCNDFLDTMPDNRTELDTPEKITKILVTAYPTTNWNMIAEFSSDNTDDNGSKYTDGLTPVLSREIYQWKDTKERGNDCPSVLWSSCYKAIATANHALEAIEKLESENNTVNLSAQRGEALLCRAYGHFVLSYIFCEAWSESNKDEALGIPYATKTETTVAPHYERGTIGETYKNIEKDLEEGLQLDDNNYTCLLYTSDAADE